MAGASPDRPLESAARQRGGRGRAATAANAFTLIRMHLTKRHKRRDFLACVHDFIRSRSLGFGANHRDASIRLIHARHICTSDQITSVQIRSASVRSMSGSSGIQTSNKQASCRARRLFMNRPQRCPPPTHPHTQIEDGDSDDMEVTVMT